jgi:hypothetical protein
LELRPEIPTAYAERYEQEQEQPGTRLHYNLPSR